MKAYTDLEQSKKLAEILRMEGADMCYQYQKDRWVGEPTYKEYPQFEIAMDKRDIPCWSLAALLSALPFPQLSKDKLGSGKVGWMVSAYPDNCRYDSCWHDNPIDACYEMILKLHELNLL